MAPRRKRQPEEDVIDLAPPPPFESTHIDPIDELAEDWRDRGTATGDEFVMCAARVLKALGWTLRLRDDEARKALETAALRLLVPDGVIGRAVGVNVAEFAATEREAFDAIAHGLQHVIEGSRKPKSAETAEQVARMFVVLAKQRCPGLLPRVKEARTSRQHDRLVAALTKHLVSLPLRDFGDAEDQAEHWFRELLVASGMPRSRARNSLKFRLRP